MENKKLLKFLYKDIAEIEELFQDRGVAGFDEYEREFIGSRFKGAKQIVQILTEKENKKGEDTAPKPLTEKEKSGETHESVSDEANKKEPVPLREDEKERLDSLAEFEEELKKDKNDFSGNGKAITVKEEKAEEKVEEVEEEAEQIHMPSDRDIEIENEEDEKRMDVHVEEEAPVDEVVLPVDDESMAQSEQTEKKPEPKPEPLAAPSNNRLGDNFTKEKSVNELLSGEVSNLEHKISNSPVAKLQKAIGINDRYQFIRELFEGNAEAFSKAIHELDNLNTINEAVSYIQQNYKWKKTEVSLKFVSLVKRRFSNE